MLFTSIVPVLASVSLVMASKDYIDQDYSQVCAGMYSKSSWGGARDPSIDTTLDFWEGHSNVDNDDSSVALSIIIFEYKDIELLGAPLSDGNKKYICDDAAVENGICDIYQLGRFIFSSENQGKNTSEVLTTLITSAQDLSDINYNVINTGYYCVATYTVNYDARYQIEVDFKNSFGEISAAEYPKIPLYAILAIIYAICLAVYGFNFYKHRSEILPLQKNFLFFFVFLTIETVLTFGYFELENKKGSDSAGVKTYMTFVSILNGFKLTFSFYLLLIIALGYGIVYPKLDRKLLLKCKILAGVHFAFDLAYIIVNYLSSPESELNASGFVVIPVMIVTMIFYVSILKSLSITTQLLAKQKQVIKLQMYNNLFRIIFFSLLVLILGVFVSSFIFLGMSTVELIEQHWKTRFFFLDFWPALVYLVIFNMIAFIWRPTDTSYMLAASSQLPTDPENAADFELDDIQSVGADGYQNVGDNDSLDLNDDDDDFEDNRVGAQVDDTSNQEEEVSPKSKGKKE